VVISTYQSIEVLERAQKEFNFPQFDLIISDEAHYTTGVSDPKKITTFKKVHSNRYVEGKRRLYMTATPKIFNLVTKRKAKEEELVIYDMGDTSIYGPTFFEYTFYKAVQEGFLTDYRVIVFTISEKEVQEKLFDYLQAGNATLEETAKIFGTLKVLEGKIPNYEKVNIKRGVIFVSKISRSKRVEREFPKVAKEIDSSLNLAIKHIDGSMPASHRQTILEWLREGPQNGESVRVLTNAKVLTEGIDVPSLDSVVFFDPRKSTVDIVQAMGRIMRKAPNKRYGYLVIPVVVESDKPIEEQLASNRDFQTIWQLATALRTLDESFTARIRRLSFKKVKEGEEGKGGKIGALPFESMEEGEEEIFSITTSEEIDPELKEAIKKSIIPKIVEKVGGRKYLESWAKDVAKKVTRLRHHIDTALTYSPQIRQDFEEFLTALREVINPSITPEEAKSLLIQHLITKPIFEALFGEYNFLRQNPVAQTIEQVASHFTQFLKVETEDLEEFYREVQIRAQGIDERERQEFLRELYDSFFKTAFPDIAEKLGIVYTPIQLVDFLISSVEEILKGEFQTSLNNPDTTILEPFAGTATFVARLLQFLELESLKRKYSNGEIWANELLLLAYYIGLANVQSVYFEKSGEQKPFKFFLLTDTFQLYEKSKRGIQRKLEIFPPEYTQLMERETREPINVIISNPPWRAGQRDMTDLNMSEKYPLLDKRIKETYVDKSTSKNKNALYDSYVRAIRFASDRIGEKGVIAFVLNNGFIDANSFDGFRKSLVEEFKKIYVFNLRGNARTRGEEWQKEGGKIFGQGSRAGVALLFLVKDKKEKKDAPAKLYYYQVPDALKREEKLKRLEELGNISKVPWEEITPDSDGNWINQGLEEFKNFTPLEEIFEVVSLGITTGRDYWVYDFSKQKLEEKVKRMVESYNDQLEKVKKGEITKKEELTRDKTKISWTRSLIKSLFSKKSQPEKVKFESKFIRKGLYKPFVAPYLYFFRLFIHETSKFPQILPTASAENRIIFFTGTGIPRPFSVLMDNKIISYDALPHATILPLYLYTPVKGEDKPTNLFETPEGEVVELEGKKYRKRFNLNRDFLKKLEEKYKKSISPEMLFHYIFGVLNTPEYQQKFKNDLKRHRPRIPFPDNFDAFQKISQIGKEIADLQLNYQNLEGYPLKIEISPDCDPEKLETYFPRLKFDKKNPTQLKYNDCITIKNIPVEVHKWKIAGKSPLEWLADYLKPRTDKGSQITIDPADAILESGEKEKFLNLIKKVTQLSLKTQLLLSRLSQLKFF
jgi:predicted helicase